MPDTWYIFNKFSVFLVLLQSNQGTALSIGQEVNFAD